MSNLGHKNLCYRSLLIAYIIRFLQNQYFFLNHFQLNDGGDRYFTRLGVRIAKLIEQTNI